MVPPVILVATNVPADTLLPMILLPVIDVPTILVALTAPELTLVVATTETAVMFVSIKLVVVMLTTFSVPATLTLPDTLTLPAVTVDAANHPVPSVLNVPVVALTEPDVTLLITTLVPVMDVPTMLLALTEAELTLVVASKEGTVIPVAKFMVPPVIFVATNVPVDTAVPTTFVALSVPVLMLPLTIMPAAVRLPDNHTFAPL